MIKKYFRRFYIKFYKWNTKMYSVLKSEYEPIAIKICRKSIGLPSATLLVCPKTGKRYVKNDTLKNYIIIQPYQIDIINHTYQYNVPICLKTYSTVVNMFDGHVEERRQAMETEIRSNVNHSLENIYEQLKNKKS